MDCFGFAQHLVLTVLASLNFCIQGNALGEVEVEIQDKATKTRIAVQHAVSGRVSFVNLGQEAGFVWRRRTVETVGDVIVSSPWRRLAFVEDVDFDGDGVVGGKDFVNCRASFCLMPGGFSQFVSAFGRKACWREKPSDPVHSFAKGPCPARRLVGAMRRSR